MRVAEQILLFFCKKPWDVPLNIEKQEWNTNNALEILERIFPDFLGSIKGKSVVDYGCGFGYQSVALAQKGARTVLGIDINPRRIKAAAKLARDSGLNGQIEFAEGLEAKHKSKFDIVISQNSMEHFPQPFLTLQEMVSALKPNGQLLMTFGPPWLSPYGSHMQFFTSLPWVNILFSERTVMNVRQNFRSDGALHYEEVESGLNKMTIDRFENLIKQSGLTMKYKRYDCIKGLNFLGSLPRVREFFINQVVCILIREQI